MKDAKSYPLIVGLAIPVLMVIFIAASVLLPRLFAPPPRYDFIYSMADGHNPEVEYAVQNGKIESRDLRRSDSNQHRSNYASVKLYRHSVKENKSMGISLEESQKLTLSEATQSPDNYEVVPGSQGSSFLFFYSSNTDYSRMYLKGYGIGRELNLIGGRNFYYAYSNIRFVGWVLSE